MKYMPWGSCYIAAGVEIAGNGRGLFTFHISQATRKDVYSIQHFWENKKATITLIKKENKYTQVIKWLYQVKL